MPLTRPSALRFLALLREQRCRAHFLKADARQSVVLIVVVSIASTLLIRNDLFFLSDPSLLAMLFVVRGSVAVAAVVAAMVLLRTRSPRKHAQAHALWGILVVVVTVLSGWTRLRVGEAYAPLIAHGALLSILYFGYRAPMWIHYVQGFSITAISYVLAWSPHAAVSSAVRLNSTLAFLVLNIVGIVYLRSFHGERRKRFEAQRQERFARNQLTVKMHELASEKERAEAMSRARTAFLATMSHEFRTPMNAVLGFSELLLDTPLNKKQQDYVGGIQDSARGLLVLLNDVLDFSKIDADKLVLGKAPFRLRALASSVVHMLRRAAAERSLELALVQGPEVPECVIGDEMRLRQVLVNLLSNAVKFTERGRVELSITAKVCGEGRHAVSFRVSDTGMGMTPEVKARLFRPFEQGDQGMERRHGGTGLGLAISQRIVEAMGGEIEVESEVQKGSVFSFTVELSASSEVPQVVEAPSSTAPRVRLSVLVVDDHLINQRVAVAMLERLGYGADVAANGLEALAAVEKKSYDVVLMDLHMPGMSGIEATKRIQERLAGRPMPHFVALTAAVFEEDRRACREVGMREVVGKPVDIRELDRVLRRFASMESRPLDVAELDPEPLEQLRQLEQMGESGLVADLCRQFEEDAPERIRRMREALKQGDAKVLEREAHSLKSVSASLGCKEMSAMCATIERSAREGDLQGLAVAVQALELEQGRVERAFARMLAGE